MAIYEVVEQQKRISFYQKKSLDKYFVHHAFGLTMKANEYEMIQSVFYLRLSHRYDENEHIFLGLEKENQSKNTMWECLVYLLQTSVVFSICLNF